MIILLLGEKISLLWVNYLVITRKVCIDCAFYCSLSHCVKWTNIGNSFNCGRTWEKEAKQIDQKEK